MIIRPYDHDADKDAVHRIWREVGWLDKGEEEAMDFIVAAGRAIVAELNGSAECLVITAPGAMRYLDSDLLFCGVTGVTTSHVARKQGLASRTAAHAIAMNVADGALVAGLGMFDQGFYNHLGFGTGGYEMWFRFDPARLNVTAKHRAPRRLTAADWEAIHAARLGRVRTHGAVSLTPATLTRGETMRTSNGFGLGYFDGPDGALSHFVWFGTRNMHSGPYDVLAIAYRSRSEFIELLALIKSLGDQVRLVTMMEPGGVQLQDFIEQPFKQRQVTENSPFAVGVRASAWWQMRICDVSKCLAETHLPGETLRFNLRLSDPIATYLPPDAPWRGVAGEYIVTLGPESHAEYGADPAIPTLATTVNAFTRLWLGALSASALTYSDTLEAPQELIEALDRTLRLPQPRIGWDV